MEYLDGLRLAGLMVCVAVGVSCAGEGSPGAGDGTQGDSGTAGTAGNGGSDDGTGASSPDTGQASADTGDTANTTDTGAQTGDSTTGDGGPQACGASGVCLPPVPSGWTGPVARRSMKLDATRLQCGGHYDGVITDGFSDPTGTDPFDCGCECGDGTTACGGSVRVRISNPQLFAMQSPCDPANGGVDGLLNETVDGSSTWAADEIPWEVDQIYGITVDTPNVGVVGSCDAIPSQTGDDPPQWSKRWTVCQTTEQLPGQCSGTDQCYPAPTDPYEAEACVWKDGNHVCPGDYPDRYLLGQTLTDERACSACYCNDPSATCQNAFVSLDLWFLAGTSFTMPISLDIPTGYCEGHNLCDEISPCLMPTTYSLHELAIEGDVVPNNGSSPCTPMPVEPTGEVSIADPSTLCCKSVG